MRLKTSSSQRKVLQRTKRAVGQSCTTCGDGLLVAPCVVRGRGSQRPGEQPRPAVRAGRHYFTDHVPKNPSTS